MASKNRFDSISNGKVILEEVFKKYIQSTYPGNMTVLAPSGKKYTWETGGAILLIENEDDFRYIISIKQPKSCCSGIPQQYSFLEI